MISCHRLTSAKVQGLRALNQLFSKAFTDPENYARQLPSDDYCHNFLANPAHIALVAVDGEEIVGGLVAYVLDKFEQERKEVYIYDLAVAQDRQRHGIGRLLMEQLRTEARQLGAYVLFVQADEGDEAIAFYEALNPDENLRTRNFDYLV